MRITCFRKHPGDGSLNGYYVLKKINGNLYWWYTGVSYETMRQKEENCKIPHVVFNAPTHGYSIEMAIAKFDLVEYTRALEALDEN